MKFPARLISAFVGSSLSIIATGRALSGERPDFSKPVALSIEPTTETSAPKNPSAEPSSEELAKLTQNPVANLISVPFQNNFNYGIGPKEATQWIMNFQPVIPIRLNDDWNLITRTIVPVINQQSIAEGVSSEFGMGDINPTLFFSPAKPGKFIWGIGPTLTAPTGQPDVFTSGKWSTGPAVVGLVMEGHWVVGALANQQWSFAGWKDESVNQTLIQPFVNYNLPHGWYLTSAPIITANWSADEHEDIWTVPVGGGFGKIVHLGKLPINLQLQGFYNTVKPDDAADWQLRFQVQLLFPAHKMH